MCAPAEGKHEDASDGDASIVQVVAGDRVRLPCLHCPGVDSTIDGTVSVHCVLLRDWQPSNQSCRPDPSSQQGGTRLSLPLLTTAQLISTTWPPSNVPFTIDIGGYAGQLRTLTASSPAVTMPARNISGTEALRRTVGSTKSAVMKNTQMMASGPMMYVYLPKLMGPAHAFVAGGSQPPAPPNPSAM